MKYFFLTLIIFTNFAFAKLSYREVKKNNAHFRVGVQSPKDNVKANILYFTGFGARMDNHYPLFQKWVDAGFRVISFDYPQHAETSGLNNRIDMYPFKNLVERGVHALNLATDNDFHTPLILSGMSTGGLISLRVLQENEWFQLFKRKILGVISFSPAMKITINPFKFGDGRGNMTQQGMTRNPNPPYTGKIKPKNAWIESPLFGLRIGSEGRKSFKKDIVRPLPIYIFSSDLKNDTIVINQATRNWVQKYRSQSTITAIKCPQGHHDLSNELEPMGSEVRNLSMFIANKLYNPNTTLPSSNSCKFF